MAWHRMGTWSSCFHKALAVTNLQHLNNESDRECQA